jgi:pyridoxamine 5'-phosphate oxidase
MSLITRLRLLLTMGRGVALGLPEASDDQDPIELFGLWFRAAQRSGILLPEAMSLATCSGDGRPAARMLLLKGFDAQGFVFYTNYESRKAEELSQNPYAALVFHWPVLQRLFPHPPARLPAGGLGLASERGAAGTGRAGAPAAPL